MCVTHMTMESLKGLLKRWNIGPIRSPQPEPEFKIADFKGMGVLLVCLSVHRLCVWCLQRTETMHPCTDSYKPCGFWKSNPPLEEQPAPLISEPSFFPAPLNQYF